MPGQNAESIFSEILSGFLKKKIGPRYSVSEKKPLLYKLQLDQNLRIRPAPDAHGRIEPKRGVYAFETDLLVEDEERPLVVLELKLGITTHDVLTYSTKAARHKEIYPYLRYGLVIGGQTTVDARFFTHNSDLDFVLAVQLTGTVTDMAKELDPVYDVVLRQIESAERLIRIFQHSKIARYETRVFTETVEGST